MAVRATQNVIASLSIAGAAHTLVTQIHVEAHAFANAAARVTSIQLAATVQTTAPVHATWFALEVLVWRHPPFRVDLLGGLDEWEGQDIMPDVFPALPGLSYSVIRRPKFFTGTGTSQSGREVRYAYAAYPLWEWDLTWEYLPDFAAPGGATPSDYKTLMGFYLAQQGALRGFLFKDPDDQTVTAQVIGATDGVTTNWTLVRTFGGSSGTEPIGYLDLGSAVHVYLDGVLQDPGGYDLVVTHPVAQVLKFHVAPAAGHSITVDMTYFFYVRFADDHYDFEKFMDRLWAQKQITLKSQRG
jgi:uncharacterized protein (TIGR02217 family)